MDPYGPQHVYAPCGHILLLFFMFFLLYSFQKDIIIPYIIDNCMTDFPHHHKTSCMTSSPYIPLFTPYSPVICKDNFSLVYMYNRVDTMLYSTLI